jgi:sphingomyelin phosphodiesterase acid-like 3
MFPRKPARFLGVRLNAGREKFLALVTLLAALTAPAAPAQQAHGVSRNKFLIVSDIHFNPMADATLVSDLAAAEPSQWETILNKSKLTSFSVYGQDTNWWLLQSALDQMRKALPHPAFVMYAGDLLAHNFPKTYRNATHDDNPEHYRAFVLKTVEFLALEFRQRWPGTRVLLTPGNNDDECGDYSIQAGGTFLSDTAQLARDLAQADDTFTNDWKGLGSFNVPHPTIQGVRIISLNTVFFSNKYHAASFNHACGPVDSTAPSDLFNWLKSNLAAAQQAKQKVWLMFHIPPGIDGYSTTHNYAAPQGAGNSASASCNPIVPMWVPTWTSQFDGLLEEFQSTVLASFAGHTHNDDFRLVNTAGVNKAFVLIDPAVSPIYDQNPGFRVMMFDHDGSLTDQSTYYLTNLKEASSKVRGRWKKEYTFSRRWKERRLDLAGLGAIYSDIQTTKEARDLWLKLYNVSSSAAKVPADTVRGLYCAIGALGVAAYESCYCPGSGQ